MPQHNAAKQGRGFSIRAEGGRAEIMLYEAIDSYYGVSARRIAAELKALGEVTAIDLRVNSPGGDVFEGTAIHTLLARHPAKVTAYVDGVAASMASVVAMAGDEIVMADGAYMMIHNPVGALYGEADEMREFADLLDKTKNQLVNIYAKRTGKSAEEIAQLMDAETWFTADEAIAAGFADRTAAKLALAASFNINSFTHVPEKLRGQIMSTNTAVPENTTTPAVPTAAPAVAPAAAPAAAQPAAGYADLKAGLPGADAEFICAQLEAKATLPQAQAAWMAEQNRRLLAAKNEATENKNNAANKATGVEPLGNGTGKNQTAAGDPIAKFNELVAAKIAAGKPKAKAVSAVIAEQPELYEEYLDAYNAAHKVTARK